MEKRIILVMVALRSKSAIMLQEILTNYGCLIKTRLGLHDYNEKTCSEAGMIFIELVGDKSKGDELVSELEALEEVTVKDIELSL